MLRRPDPRIIVYLVYGPDSGLVDERARKLAEGAVDEGADPFQLVRLEGDTVAADPGRLPDEVGTIGLFGGRRAVWVKAGGRSIAPAVEAVLDGPAGGATVVIEAGDLARSAPLRALCEGSPKALALPCYPDGDKEIGGLIDKTFAMRTSSIPRRPRSAAGPARWRPPRDPRGDRKASPLRPRRARSDGGRCRSDPRRRVEPRP